MKRKCLYLVGIFLLAAGIGCAASREGTLKTADQVDLKQYQGRWYEIARLPLRWEKQCAGDVTATYTLRPDGKVDVVNRCLKADGSQSVSKGTAELAKKDGPASKLKVTFFWPFAGDYWILELDPQYRWALVGTPDRNFLWILSRTPLLDKATTDQLLASAKASGFDTSKLIWTKQGR